MAEPQAFIGLMSGTSMDGVDGVLGLIDAQGRWQGSLAHSHRPFPDALRAELLALNTSGPDELHRAALASQALSVLYAEVVMALRQAQPEVAVTAVGAHGQTVRHRPEMGYTLQLLAPALLAELGGVDVVADLRSRDVAAGGQGAPLVPIFHDTVFGRPDAVVAGLNIGGIANISVLPPGQPPRGHDCGPGNVLMDLWVQAHRGQPYDADGAWASSGQVQADWLAQAMAEPYLALPPPKSTGRDLFHATWLQAWLARCGLADAGEQARRAADVQATLCEFTAASCAADVRRCGAQEVLVCGGGALNGHLMTRLAALVNGPEAPHTTGVVVHTSAARQLPPMEVEAAAFAWLAWAHQAKRPGNVPAVTGARGPRVLGALYPA